MLKNMSELHSQKKIETYDCVKIFIFELKERSRVDLIFFKILMM